MNGSEKSGLRVQHILVVEDEELIAELIVNLLRDEGYEVSACYRGRDALDFVKTHEVDLVLLDVLLEDMDGITVARQIKDSADRDIFLPIIMVSALGSDKDKISGLAYADDYITKPFRHTELSARVAVMLRIRQLHLQLGQSRDRYRFLYENIPEMCVSLDIDLCVWDCNNAFSRELGQGKARIIGRSLFDFFVPDDHPQLRSYLESLKSGRIQSHQPVFRLCAGSESEAATHITMRGQHVEYALSGPAAVLVMQNVGGTIRPEEDQRMARRQLYRSAQMVSIGTLASGVAHELNNPLAAILGFSDALLGRLETKENIESADFQQYLGIIKTESLRCRDIIDSLLRFSRDREPQIVNILLLECIQSATTLLSARAAKKSITVDNEISGDIIIKADPQRIGQVFYNVLANAIDFSPEGSRVTISLKLMPEAHRFVTVLITDQGPGISPENLPRVFDPFFTTKEVGYGMGVGLAICHKAMEECEGSIDIMSEKGKGTQVIMEIPRADSV